MASSTSATVMPLSHWVILLDVLPVGAVPDDRPIVHNAQYISLGYTLGIGVASGI